MALMRVELAGVSGAAPVDLSTSDYRFDCHTLNGYQQACSIQWVSLEPGSHNLSGDNKGGALLALVGGLIYFTLVTASERDSNPNRMANPARAIPVTATPIPMLFIPP